MDLNKLIHAVDVFYKMARSLQEEVESLPREQSYRKIDINQPMTPSLTIDDVLEKVRSGEIPEERIREMIRTLQLEGRRKMPFSRLAKIKNLIQKLYSLLDDRTKKTFQYT